MTLRTQMDNPEGFQANDRQIQLRQVYQALVQNIIVYGGSGMCLCRQIPPFKLKGTGKSTMAQVLHGHATQIAQIVAFITCEFY